MACGYAFTPDEMRTVVNLYNQGCLVKDIAGHIGRTRYVVRDILELAGIKRSWGRPSNKSIEELHGAIGICSEERRLISNAKAGSEQLRRALETAGLRP